MASGFKGILRWALGWKSAAPAALAIVSTRYVLIGTNNSLLNLEGTDNSSFALIGTDNASKELTGE